VACGVVYAAARRFKVPLPNRWWEVFDAKWSDVQTVCKVLAALYKQPKAEYIEVGRSSKSFVLASKAWDSPMDTQGGSLKRVTNGAAPVLQGTEVGRRNGIGLKSASGKVAEIWMQSERGIGLGCEKGIRTGKGSERKQRSGSEKVGGVKSIDTRKEAGT
jgi:hypothetical protein